ncbi:MAG: glycerol kinase GlpK [Lachnospiraceae bacterium]|nr:glycerol kinase GlpK [Lachnospiraceae bacterium]
MGKYIIGVDQSTQGTKAVLFDENGILLAREDLPHRQIINEEGWVSHDLDEIYRNTVAVIRTLINDNRIEKREVAALGISNQRESTGVWYKDGTPCAHSIVWQCSRAKDIAAELLDKGWNDYVKESTGMPLSPFFPAVKAAWFLRNCEGLSEKAENGEICFGTMDTFLLYRLTGGTVFKTDYSNASRTQLFDIRNFIWDEKICGALNIPVKCLPEVCDSDALFGMTDLEGFLENPIPVHAMLGDSHAALFGQGCLEPGMVKSTFGTGSSIMMNTGGEKLTSQVGLVTSLAWKIGGKAEYVLEGNINYTGATISWLKDDVQLIESASETETLAREANPEDTTIMVPAFTGLGAPYWNNEAQAIICGMTRLTGKKELIKAAVESIAYQISDIIFAMESDYGRKISDLRVDGGPTRNGYLMQFLSDILDRKVLVPELEEFSAIGAAYAAGISVGIYDQKTLFEKHKRMIYKPNMSDDKQQKKLGLWKEAVKLCYNRS